LGKIHQVFPPQDQWEAGAAFIKQFHFTALCVLPCLGGDVTNSTNLEGKHDRNKSLYSILSRMIQGTIIIFMQMLFPVSMTASLGNKQIL